LTGAATAEAQAAKELAAAAKQRKQEAVREFEPTQNMFMRPKLTRLADAACISKLCNNILVRW
jgi:hypothetical protein